MGYTDTIRTLYNKCGQEYHDSRREGPGRLHNEFIDRPALVKLLPKSLKGLKVLDAGCGSGITSTLLARRGAVVNGIDLSPTMIDIACKETPRGLKVEYLIGTLTHLPFANNSFDLVVCTYVLENIKSLATAFTEFSRVLKSKGSVIFSISHPIKAQSTGIDPLGKKVRVIEDYFASGMRQADFGHGLIVPKFRRPLEAYTIAATNAGFLISDLREPRPIAAGKKVAPEGYEVANRLPQLLTMKLIKSPLWKPSSKK